MMLLIVVVVVIVVVVIVFTLSILLVAEFLCFVLYSKSDKSLP